jgi:bifunctional cystathionine gamma-lyase/maltose regulon repressor
MPNKKHTVFQTIDDKLAERTITFTAPSKTFNLAGMGMSNTIIKNKELHDRFINSLNRTCSIPFTALGYKSCEIAYTQCEEWLKECLEVIYKNQQLIVEFFEKNYPEIKVIKNEGTYLLWVDFRALNMEPEDLEKFMINEASIFLDEGYIFGENGKGFERFNLAAPTSVIEETLQRLDKALKKLKNN